MAFLGIAALRRFVDDPVRRATWSAVATVVGFIDVPIVYYSVKWWNSLHQQQSTAAGISREFRIPLLLNFSALLLLIVGVLVLRSRVAALHAEEELPPLTDWDEIAMEVTS
jgi:heme exporter protein C